MFFDDNHLPRAEVIRAAKKQAQRDGEKAQAATDRYNGAIMRRDAQLRRFLMAYTKLAASDREGFVDRALAAGKAVTA
jgi:hypothetical protein